MTEHDIWGFRVEIGEIVTSDWYARSEQWGCDCGHCRNFLKLALERALPAQVLEMLDRFDIPPEKATYVCEMCANEGGHCYQFSYRMAGRILCGDETSTTKQDWGAGRCCHEPYPYGAPDFPEPHFDLEFWVTLPWVLDEPDK